MDWIAMRSGPKWPQYGVHGRDAGLGSRGRFYRLCPNGPLLQVSCGTQKPLALPQVSRVTYCFLLIIPTPVLFRCWVIELLLSKLLSLSITLLFYPTILLLYTYTPFEFHILISDFLYELHPRPYYIYTLIIYSHIDLIYISLRCDVHVPLKRQFDFAQNFKLLFILF